MKKKSLLATLALMLVAIMCFASASYAWFKTGDTSKVDGLTTKIQLVSSGLEFCAATPDANGKPSTQVPTDGWTYNINLKDGTGVFDVILSELTAVSAQASTSPTFFSSTFKSATSTLPDRWGDFTAVETANSENYIAVPVWVRISDGRTSADVTFKDGTAISGNAANALRLGLKYDADSMLIFDNSASTASTNNVITSETSGDTQYVSGVNFTPVGTGFFASQNNKLISDYKTETLFQADNVGKLLWIYFWVEGQDPDCTGSISASDASATIELKVPANTAS